MDIFSWSWLSDGTPYLGLIVWHGSIHFSTKEVDLGDFKFRVLSMEVQTRIAKENNTVCLISIWYMVKPRGAFVYSNLNTRLNTVEPRYIKRSVKGLAIFVCYDEVSLYQGFFSTYFTISGVKKIFQESLYRRPRYIGVRCIDVPLYINNAQNEELFPIWLW